MFVSSSYRITWLRYTNKGRTLGAAYVSSVYLENCWVILDSSWRHHNHDIPELGNHWVTLHLLVSMLKSSILLFTLPVDSLVYPTLMGVQP